MWPVPSWNLRTPKRKSLQTAASEPEELSALAVAWACTRWPGPVLTAGGWLFVAGTVVFSGSLYALALSGVRWLGAITPLGGLAFLAGWLCLAWTAWRAPT